MPRYLLILLCCYLVFVPPVAALSNADLLPADQAFQLKVQANSQQQLMLSWHIAEGYYLYRDKMKFKSQTEGVELGQASLPAGELKHDPTFGEVRIFRSDLSIELPIVNAQQQSDVQLFVQYQGCADVGVCYPPQKTVLDVSLPKAASPATANGTLEQFVRGLKTVTPAFFQAELLPPEQAFQFFATVNADGSVHANWLIADGYYLYKNKLALNLQSAPKSQLSALSLPVGEAKHDEEWGDVEVYRHELAIDVPVQRNGVESEDVVLIAKFQGCADRGVCYPPMQKEVNLTLPAVQAKNEDSTPAPENSTTISEQDRIVASLKHDSLALTLLSFFGFGLLLAHTPCVFPMIPILSGIIVGHGDRVGSRQSFLLSASFVFASALMYTLFGILAALFGSNLQAVLQQPWVIAMFSAVFVLLSLSMFGFFDLQLPASLQSKLHHSSDQHRDGSYWGAGIMGALSSLIVGPCVAAPLAAALIYIGQTGDVILGGAALFVMGLGMGGPLLLIGASAGKLLPKSGAWMNVTKSVFGVIMLAVAVWMLSRIVPAQVTLLLTAMLLIIPAIYLNALEPLPFPVSGWKKLWKGVGLMMLAFGILQLIGLGAGGTNPLQPLAGLALAGTGRGEASQGLRFQRVKTLAELDAKLLAAKAKGQWVMLDFYADWCISCKEMEAYTFTNATVQQQLSNFVLLQADVTLNDTDDKALLKRFNLFGPPGIIFFAPDGIEQSSQRVIGFQDAVTFLQSLSHL